MAKSSEKKATRKSETAYYRLSDSWENPNQDAIIFPGFPGVWRRGEAQSAASLGIHPADLDRLIEEFGLGDAFAKTASAPKGAAEETFQAVGGSSADIQADATALLPRSWSPMPGLSAEEYTERIAWEARMYEAGEIRQKSAVLEQMEVEGGLSLEPAPLTSPGPGFVPDEGQHPAVVALDARRDAQEAARAHPGIGGTDAGDTSGTTTPGPVTATPTAAPVTTGTNVSSSGGVR